MASVYVGPRFDIKSFMLSDVDLDIIAVLANKYSIREIAEAKKLDMHTVGVRLAIDMTLAGIVEKDADGNYRCKPGTSLVFSTRKLDDWRFRDGRMRIVGQYKIEDISEVITADGNVIPAAWSKQ